MTKSLAFSHVRAEKTDGLSQNSLKSQEKYQRQLETSIDHNGVKWDDIKQACRTPTVRDICTFGVDF